MHFRYGKTFCRLAQECEENMLLKLSSEQSRKTVDRPVRFLPQKMVPDKANMRLQHTLNKYKKSKDFKGKFCYLQHRIYTHTELYVNCFEIVKNFAYSNYFNYVMNNIT